MMGAVKVLYGSEICWLDPPINTYEIYSGIIFDVYSSFG